jgi:hypothetical protein
MCKLSMQSRKVFRTSCMLVSRNQDFIIQCFKRSVFQQGYIKKFEMCMKMAERATASIEAVMNQLTVRVPHNFSRAQEREVLRLYGGV